MASFSPFLALLQKEKPSLFNFCYAPVRSLPSFSPLLATYIYSRLCWLRFQSMMLLFSCTITAAVFHSFLYTHIFLLPTSKPHVGQSSRVIVAGGLFFSSAPSYVKGNNPIPSLASSPPSICTWTIIRTFTTFMHTDAPSACDRV